jgi:thiamine phosphate synthase YjbQ (UPF0047 family)
VVFIEHPALTSGSIRDPMMKSHTEYLTMTLPSKMAFVNITPQVEEALRKSGVKEGIVLVNQPRRSVLLSLPRG